ncbi:MAG TPA: hypothetical protein VGO25_14265 [Rhodanobacteraceae bacterium]|jgi:hypothetical protein|nr:hypothetical protein [Rhodanobacteraceae bacterium]
MKTLLAALLFSLPVAAAATEVMDNFESGTNPNQWGWTNNGGGHFIIEPSGGSPGAWLDSGTPYYSDHPNLTSIPPDGSALRAALASGTLTSATFMFEKLQAGCFPTYDSPSTFSLAFFDLHSDPGGAVIEAHTTSGPSSIGVPHATPWRRVQFSIPSNSTDPVPDGWELNAPPELNYTWQDLMQNIDGMRFWVINPDDFTFDACWRLGADNVAVDYGNTVPATQASPRTTPNR